MAQKVVKTIISHRPPIPPKRSLDDVPEVIISNRPPKISKVKRKETTRFGNLSVGTTPARKPKQEENGAKIK